MTTLEIRNLLRSGKRTSVGSYPTFFITADGEALSHESVRENYRLVSEAIRDGFDRDWIVVGADVNWENPHLYCAHSDERIESAYAEEDIDGGFDRMRHYTPSL